VRQHRQHALWQRGGGEASTSGALVGAPILPNPMTMVETLCPAEGTVEQASAPATVSLAA
jgi:hypothetical protein